MVKVISDTKRQLGQYYTRQEYWLLPQVISFIKSTNSSIAYDPFAGDGHLLKAVKKLGLNKAVGLDISKNLRWKSNDSLIDVPKLNNSIIITNPPYLTNYSAKRKGIYKSVAKYFEDGKYDDLYQVAIEKCLNNERGVMIIPETFINSSFPKNRLSSITILEKNPFEDTENPVCIICFDDKIKSKKDIKIYKNDIYLGNLEYFEKFRLKPQKHIRIKFNDISGKIALRAVDGVNPKAYISFMKKEHLDYDLKGIKHSSRLITLINAQVDNKYLDVLIHKSNKILKKYRDDTCDILLSPFKGNRKDGIRRRRLDYQTARAILELAYINIIGQRKLNL